jgi:hypothetical protein
LLNEYCWECSSVVKSISLACASPWVQSPALQTYM